MAGMYLLFGTVSVSVLINPMHTFFIQLNKDAVSADLTARCRPLTFSLAALLSVQLQQPARQRRTEVKPTVQLEAEPITDSTPRLTRFIISPNELTLTVSERLVNLSRPPQCASIYINHYTGHDNQSRPLRRQSAPSTHCCFCFLFNLEGFHASSESL